MPDRLAQLFLAIIALSSAQGCVSGEFASPERSEPARFEQISPQEDPLNRSLMQKKLRTSIIVTLNISDTDIDIANMQIMRVPAPANPPEDSIGDIYLVAVDSADREAGRAVIVDRSIRVLEGTGLIEAPNRTAIGTIPLTRMPDRLKISAPTLDYEPETIGIKEMMDDFCVRYPENELCRESPPDAAIPEVE